MFYLARNSTIAAAIVLVAVFPISAQTNAARAHLDAGQLRRVVEALAHDSAAGRPTPSPQLDAAAAYVAAA